MPCRGLGQEPLAHRAPRATRQRRAQARLRRDVRVPPDDDGLPRRRRAPRPARAEHPSYLPHDARHPLRLRRPRRAADVEARLRRLGALHGPRHLRRGRRRVDTRQRRHRVRLRLGQGLQGEGFEQSGLPHPGARPADRRAPQGAPVEGHLQRRAPPPLLPQPQHRAVPHGLAPRRRVHRPRDGREPPEPLGPQRLPPRQPALQRPRLRRPAPLWLLHRRQDHRLQRPRAARTAPGSRFRVSGGASGERPRLRSSRQSAVGSRQWWRMADVPA